MIYNNKYMDTYDDITVDFCVEMLNEYLIYYRNITNSATKTTMFDNVKVDNLISTNEQMEGFYDAKCKFELYQNTDPLKITVMTPEHFVDDGISEMFGIRKNDKLIFVSVSLLALLIEIVNLNREKDINDIYEIVPLRRE